MVDVTLNKVTIAFLLLCPWNRRFLICPDVNDILSNWRLEIRQGFHEQDLAVRFGVSQATVSRILLTWANYLYVMLGSLQIWPSHTFIDANMPVCFKRSALFDMDTV